MGRCSIQFAFICSWFSAVILVHVSQQYQIGLLVQVERTGIVSLIGLATVLIQIATAVFGFQHDWSAVSTICSAHWLSQSVNLCALAVSSRMTYRDPSNSGPIPRYAELWRYFWPIAITGMVYGLSRPLLFGFVGRAPNAILSTAALRVGFDVIMIFQVCVNQFRHFFAAFGTDGLAEKRVFMRRVVTGLLAIMILIALTPLSEILFGLILGLRGDLYTYSRQVTSVAIGVPALLAVRNYYQGILLSEKRTTAMALGSLLRIIAIAAVAATMLGLGWLGPVTAALAMVTGFLTEMVVAFAAVRRLRRAG